MDFGRQSGRFDGATCVAATYSGEVHVKPAERMNQGLDNRELA